MLLLVAHTDSFSGMGKPVLQRRPGLRDLPLLFRSYRATNLISQAELVEVKEDSNKFLCVTT